MPESLLTFNNRSSAMTEHNNYMLLILQFYFFFFYISLIKILKRAHTEAQILANTLHHYFRIGGFPFRLTQLF